MTLDDQFLEDTAEDLFEDAPCAYISTRLDGTIVKVNRTFETWTGLHRADVVESTRFRSLLSRGAQIYHETHVMPLLRMQGFAREIAVELKHADGSLLPALVNATLSRDDGGGRRRVFITAFDATDRRAYERELLEARRREQRIAEQLQRSMLAGTLPSADGLEIDVAYRPGVAGLQVGGDWYDAFWLDDGDTIGLVIGDVVGRGIDAATTMGQLKSALRALASTGLAPGELLTALDGYSRRHDVGRMATLVYAQLELGTRVFRYACAGHPPPLVTLPDADPAYLCDGRSPPLDSHRSDTRPRPEGTATLAPGATVLLYTDGLIEDRSRPLAEGMDELAAQAAATRRGSTGSLTAALVDALGDAEHPDDICALAARLV